MYLQEIVEVAIGLIFAWLLLSIAVLQVQEIIANIFAKRAIDLENAIRGMLNDPQKLVELYNHPLIKNLSKPVSEAKQKIIDELDKKIINKEALTTADKISLWWNKPRPSYIPSSNFAIALFDIVTTAGESDSQIKRSFSDLRTTIGKLEAGDRQSASEVFEYIVSVGQTLAGTSSDKLKGALVNEMNEQLSNLGAIKVKGEAPFLPFTKVIAGEMQDINNGDFSILLKSTVPYLEQLRKDATVKGGAAIGKALNSLLAGVEEYATDAEKALAIGRKNAEDWFNSTMDRMGGWYKRWAQIWAFAIGLIIAAAFNIDSIRIANTLWQMPELRTATADYIQGYIQKETAKDDFNIEDVDLGPIKTQLQGMSYPVGWNGDCPKGFTGWLYKIVGLLVTAGAAMQGAPFWFDTLKKLVNIRSSGVNPNEKPKNEERRR